MQKLNDIEVIKNSRNLHNNLTSNNILRTTTTTTTTPTTIKANNNNNKLNILETREKLNDFLTTTKQKEQQNIDEACNELRVNTETMMVAVDTTITTPTTKYQENEYRTKDNNTDTDSALSSAPPSISPQPPPAGMESADIWQTIRTYTADIEKLQKDIELMQKENENLQKELNLAKEQIMETEKTAIEAAISSKVSHLHERIKYLEDHEHQLLAESNELREQNELLEFRILELEESNDKWSLQSHNTPSSGTSLINTVKDLWACDKTNRHEANSLQDSGITSPHSQHQLEDEMQMIDNSNDELRRRITTMMRKSSLDDEDKRCLQQLLSLVQQLDSFSMRSGPDSLNTNTSTTSSADEIAHYDLVKSRVSDYSSASSPLSSPSSSSSQSSSSSSSLSSSSSSSHNETSNATKSSVTRITTTTSSASAATVPTPTTNTNSRIVATVSPYNSIPSTNVAPTNTPTESPRRQRPAWQSCSLSESGIFVEADFLSDYGEPQSTACTQTDFDEGKWLYRSGGCEYKPSPSNTPTRGDNRTVAGAHYHSNRLLAGACPSASSHLSDQKRLQYYQERLALLESKVLIYESSGDIQAKHLADRLQREIQLEKQLKELQDRVEYLEAENLTLDEEKCEFEEAENDTRLRLQRLEVELEILSQRNVELEMSREALSAKYQDCRSECLILRDDLAVSETQIRHLEEDKLKAKENFEFLHGVLPLLLLYHQLCGLTADVKEGEYKALPVETMGNTASSHGIRQMGGNDEACLEPSSCNDREIYYLKEEIKCLRHQIKELNSHHYEAMESADSHWVDLEREYKEREEAFRCKEMCLKQKIQKLQDCIRDDQRAAQEKIQQMEENENEIKCCLIRISKEHQDLIAERNCLCQELERIRESCEKMEEQQKPMNALLDNERKRNKNLNEEITFLRKLQNESETRLIAEADQLRTQMYEMKKELLHADVTNGELKEEVTTLEHQLKKMLEVEKDQEDKIRVLTDEVRNKDEICQRLEKELQRETNFCLAQEMGVSPSKRFRRSDIKDLRTANLGLKGALKGLQNNDLSLPINQRFRDMGCTVKKLADELLGETDIKEKQNEKEKRSHEKEREETGKNADTHREIEEVRRESIKESPSVLEAQGMAESDADASPDAYANANADVNNQPGPQTSNENVVTVGMALVPHFTIDDKSLPVKKQIFEVPSELRKLSLVPPINKAKSASDMRHKNSKSRMNTKRNKPIYRWNVRSPKKNSLRARVRGIVSCLQTAKVQIFHDPSDVDMCQSEILHNTTSFDSFYSLKEDPHEAHAKKVDAFTEMDTVKVDIGTETMVQSIESSVQADDDMNPDKYLEILPVQERNFLIMLRVSVSHAKIDELRFNQEVVHIWNTNDEFRKGLEILKMFINFDNDTENCVSMDDYEHFVQAMAALHTLERIFEPVQVPLLQQIGDHLDEKLMQFHRQKMESEFYCTVYYPVKRQVPLDISDFIAKCK